MGGVWTFQQWSHRDLSHSWDEVLLKTVKYEFDHVLVGDSVCVSGGNQNVYFSPRPYQLSNLQTCF